jgi:DNA polymerase-3 subunit gamma/tau
MAYQVIARKYRPQRFADVVGQEHVTQTLANAIQQKRIAHAYLFCGPRGTGKTTVARIFAKCLNCTDGPKVDFDDADQRCIEITEGRSIDVMEIDGASNNGVEQVRELRETVKYSPASSRYKIYIIDEVHMLTTAAFNALLKTLEEPPDHVKFMFATTDPEKVLPTILSRCQRFDLRRIPVSLITQHLSYIAEKEGVKIDAEALHAIARGADGGMRDAESALDQLISFCGTEIAESDVLSMFGLTARSQVVALGQAVLLGDAAGALRELNALARHGKDLGRLLSDLLGHFRNLLLFQVSGGDASLLEVTEAELASLREQAVSVETEALTRLLEVLTDAEGRLRDAASRKIFVEVSLLKAIQARKAVSIDFVIKRLQQLKDNGTGGGGGASTGSGSGSGSGSGPGGSLAGAQSAGGGTASASSPRSTAPASRAPAIRAPAAPTKANPEVAMQAASAPTIAPVPSAAFAAKAALVSDAGPKAGADASVVRANPGTGPTAASAPASDSAAPLKSAEAAAAPLAKVAANNAADLSPREAVGGAASAGTVRTPDRPAAEPVQINLESVWAGLMESVGRASPFTRGPAGAGGQREDPCHSADETD